MSTITQTSAALKGKTQRTSRSGVDTWFNNQAEKFEKSRFGWMAFCITFQSCLGSVAAGFILNNNAHILVLAACAVITMMCNAVFIGLGSAKLCLSTFYLSVVLNTIFILTNL